MKHPRPVANELVLAQRNYQLNQKEPDVSVNNFIISFVMVPNNSEPLKVPQVKWSISVTFGIAGMELGVLTCEDKALAEGTG